MGKASLILRLKQVVTIPQELNSSAPFSHYLKGWDKFEMHSSYQEMTEKNLKSMVCNFKQGVCNSK